MASVSDSDDEFMYAVELEEPQGFKDFAQGIGVIDEMGTPSGDAFTSLSQGHYLPSHMPEKPLDDVRAVNGGFADVAETVGPFGKFQKLYAALFVGVIWFLAAANTYVMIFASLLPPRFEDCSFNTSANCSIAALPDTDCTTPYFYINPSLTVASEWKLDVCSSVPVSVTSSAFFGGYLFGVTLLGALSDYYGRRPTIHLSVAIFVISGTLSTWSPGPYYYCGARALVGFGVAGAGLASYVLLSEIVGKDMRMLITVLHSVSFALGGCYITFVATIWPEWRSLSHAAAIPGFVMVMLYFSYLNIESPLWQATRGEGGIFNAMATWQVIATVNGNDATVVEKMISDQEAIGSNVDLGDPVNQSASADSVRDTIPRALCSKPVGLWIMAMSTLWFSTSLGYYGISLAIPNLKRDVAEERRLGGDYLDWNLMAHPYSYIGVRNLSRTPRQPVTDGTLSRILNSNLTIVEQTDVGPAESADKDAVTLVASKQTIGAPTAMDEASRPAEEHFEEHFLSVCFSTFTSFLLEVPAVLVAAALTTSPTFGRKKTTIIFSSFGGLCCLAACAIHHISAVSILAVQLVSSFGRLFYAGAFIVLYPYSSEVCPTSLRSSLLGVCSMFARISGIITPLLVQGLETLLPASSFLAFFFITMGSVITGYKLLPETRGWLLQPDVNSMVVAWTSGTLKATPKEGQVIGAPTMAKMNMENSHYSTLETSMTSITSTDEPLD